MRTGRNIYIAIQMTAGLEVRTKARLSNKVPYKISHIITNATRNFIEEIIINTNNHFNFKK